jgi:hypothetical protein
MRQNFVRARDIESLIDVTHELFKPFRVFGKPFPRLGHVHES